MRGKFLMRMMISIAVLMTMAILPMGHMVEADEVDISFPDIDGTITYDQTWSGTKSFGEVRIQAGVTVTVSPGAVLENYGTSSFIMVEGTLNAIGTEGSSILFGKPGSSWDKIWSSSDGSIHMENCSVRSGNCNIQLSGAPSYLKNVTAIGGVQGFKINSEGNQMIDCTALDSTNYGFLVTNILNGLNLTDPHAEGCKYSVYMLHCHYVNITGATIFDSTTYSVYGASARYTHMDDCRIENGGSYAVLLTGGCHGSLVENSRLNGTLGGIYIGSNDMTVRNCDITFSEDDEAYWGIILGQTIQNLLIEDCLVNNCEWGISYMTNKWSDATIRGTTFGPNVRSVMIPESLTIRGEADEEINVTFEHCDLNSNTSIVMGLKESSNVEMINSTWNQELDEPFNLSGGEVNISWFMDFKATDGNGDLTPFNVLAEAVNGDELIDIDVNSGYIEDVEIPLWHINDTEEREVLYDLTITSLVDPNVKLSESGAGPYGDTLLWLFWDLPPTNTIPDPITLDEDERISWNLSEHFVDPEGHPIEYDITADPNVFYELDGSNLTFGGVDDFHGETWIKISGTDEGGNTSFENVTITVLPINDAPEMIMDLPELTTEEDTSVWINLSGYGEDVEGDTFFWNSSAVQHAALSWDRQRINLTIIPEADWNGVLEIELNLSDGVDWINPVLIVNVTPVNDAPTGAVIWPNGTDVVSGLENIGGVNVTTLEVEIEEDTSISFSIDATDIDGDDLLYLYDHISLVLGTLAVETYTYLNETNESVTGTVPYNFTYVPDPDVNGEDIVMFLVHDGLVNGTLCVKFIILPINDHPILDVPVNWTEDVTAGTPKSINISNLVSDIDGDELTLAVSGSPLASIDGMTIVLDYPETYTGSGDTLTVTLSDGNAEVSVELTVNVYVEVSDWEVTDVKIKASEDGWTVTAEGGEGQDVYLVIVGEDGEKESFSMTWDGEKYTVNLDEEDAGEGMEYYVAGTKGGENPNPGTVTSLPKLAEKDESSGSLTVVIIVLLVIILAFIIAIVAVARKGKGSKEEEWGDEE